MQCNKDIETFSHIFKCEVVKEYLDSLSTHVGTPKVFEMKSMLVEYYQWIEHKKRTLILSQFSVSSLYISLMLFNRR